MFNNIKEMINKMDNNKKRLMIISLILILILIILGITYASYVWNSKEEQNTNVVFSASTGFSCAADGGGDINNGDVYLMPTEVNESTSSMYIKRAVKVSPTITDSGKGVSMDLWLNINELGEGLSNSVNFKYAFTTSSTSNVDGVVSTGNFNGKKVGDKVNLLEGKKYALTTERTYYLWLWIDAVETNPSVLNQSFSLSLGGVCNEAEIPSGAQPLIDKANPSTLAYANATDSQKGEMWTFNHVATAQTSALTDYRYVGNNPNNYINFNNEVWRIIGVFDGKIKLVKNESLGDNFAWDKKTEGVGSSISFGGSNDWSDAQMMYMLNPTTYDLKDGYTSDADIIYDANGNIIYQLGCYPSEISVGQTSYNCNPFEWRIADEFLSYLDKTTYYLGATDDYIGTTYSLSNADSFYSEERGTNTISGRPLIWNGYVSLPYASDYLYSFSGSNNSWMSDYFGQSWLLNVNIATGGYYPNAYVYGASGNMVYSAYADGFIVYDDGDNYNTFPVAYLEYSTQLTGSGTSDNPYEIVME